MLSLGPGSSCDVCFERFGKDRKVPISIACGHVFCNTCVAQLLRTCPLCRTPFTQASCIKLHVDIDAVVQECTEEQLNQAQKLQRSMCNIADQGITEPLLRQLIQEGKDFLKTQPKHLHRDLRAFHRVVTYLCEVRSNLRSQKPAVAKLHDEIQNLKGDKAALQKQLADQEEQYKQDRESSLAVETSLRSSYHDAIDVYHSTIELYNKVAQQNSELMAKLSAHLASSSSKRSLEEKSSANNSTVRSLLTPVVTAGNLQEVGVQDPSSSFLISPLPQFTSNLPSIGSSLSALPDIEEEESEGEGEYESEEELEEGEEVQDDGQDEGLFTDDDDAPHSQEVRASESSGLTRTAPTSNGDFRRARSHSHPVPMTNSRSESPTRSLISPPPTSTLQSSGYTAHHLAAFSYSQHSKEPPSIDTPYMVPVERLQSILDMSPSPSSSWPNSSANYFPSSYTSRDSFNYHDGRVSPPDSLTDRSSNSSKTSASSYQQSSPPTPYSQQSMPIPYPQHSSSTGDKYGNMLASSPQSYMNKAAPSSSPNPISHGHGLSTASAQALKLEEERRRRKEMEQLAQEHGDRLHSFSAESEGRRTAVVSPASSTASASTVTSGATTTQGPRSTQSSFYVDPVITSASMSQWRQPTNNTQSSTYSGRPGQSTATATPQQPYDQRQPTKYPSSASTSYPSKPSMLST